MNILQEIAGRARERVEAQKRVVPLPALMEQAHAPARAQTQARARTQTQAQSQSRGPGVRGFPFEAALRRPDGVSLICEIKRASPSKGVIAGDFPYVDIARAYEAAGAAAISVLTEPYYFKGDDRYLREIADAVSLPLLRKDFTVDSYMIYEAKLLGADAVLLICALLGADVLAEYIAVAHSLGLSALVEAHDEREVEMALGAGARIVGVNNRDLKTFEVDVGLSARLRKLVPEGVIFVSESGIRTPEDVAGLRAAGVDAALIGETIMRSADKAAAIARLRGERP